MPGKQAKKVPPSRLSVTIPYRAVEYRSPDLTEQTSPTPSLPFPSTIESIEIVFLFLLFIFIFPPLP
ncbi:hypothetical protein L873DRAFT_1820558 [Choiromyces venosus 120613-1]|uniref:Uncharacterized protein n=1 Tax=Choiromyces venosus 120613-1 TaxID=1336337 RepID=A0A3N4J0I0_9PEZI|nr:hypothetical protein L873DRAFT_1820558 [Choiromyces venosus 120613-1]